MSALPPKADVASRLSNVRFGPIVDIEPVYSITSSARVVELLLQIFRSTIRPPSAIPPSFTCYPARVAAWSMRILAVCCPASFTRY